MRNYRSRIFFSYSSFKCKYCLLNVLYRLYTSPRREALIRNNVRSKQTLKKVHYNIGLEKRAFWLANTPDSSAHELLANISFGGEDDNSCELSNN